MSNVGTQTLKKYCKTVLWSQQVRQVSCGERYSLLIKKDIHDRQNMSVKLLCVYVCLSSGDLFIFRKFSIYIYTHEDCLKSFQPSLQPTRNSGHMAVGWGPGQEQVSPPH